MTLEIGKFYKTRGGWKAKIIWKFESKAFIPNVIFYVIHKPGEGLEDIYSDRESVPIAHTKDGKAVGTFLINCPPDYGQLPADLISEWEDAA